jgi:hypothetical protein
VSPGPTQMDRYDPPSRTHFGFLQEVLPQEMQAVSPGQPSVPHRVQVVTLPVPPHRTSGEGCPSSSGRAGTAFPSLPTCFTGPAPRARGSPSRGRSSARNRPGATAWAR